MKFYPSMVQAITVLTVLKMMTKAQTSCGSGSMSGKVMYERLPNIQLQGFDDDIVRDSGPPFMVLEKCQDLCLRDRTSSNIVRACSSFDFQPGSRIANYNSVPDYEESTCYLTAEQSRPEGIGSLMLVPNSVHFTEVCITSNRPERECPNRRYIFERHPRKKLKLPPSDIKEVEASNRTECEDKCLNEFSFVCRSATFDSAMRSCTLSRFTRRTHPEMLVDGADADYLENTCLNAERRCDGLAVFIKEENKRLGGPFEVDLFTNLTLEDCQTMCVRAEKYFCRSIEYDEMTKQCTISEEDSVSQKDDIGVASSPSHHFYDFACLDSPRGSEYPDNSVTSHLFSGKKPDTAFQRYRNSRLGGEHHSEISGRSLSECLDECLRQPSFQCRSAEYSERFRTCRLTRYNQKDGMRIIYDADYDYYENLMLGGDGGTDNSVYRPGEDRYPGPSRPPQRYPPGSGGSAGERFPPGRYPPTPSRYPDDDRYPQTGRYPDRGGYGGGRYPAGEGGRYPVGEGGRYPAGEGGRYPVGEGGRYPGGEGGRYPVGEGGRYPAGEGGRYPVGEGGRYPGGEGGRYPVGEGGRYPGGEGGRYPVGEGGRYPGGVGGRYPAGEGGRYPDDGRPPLGPGRYPSGGYGDDGRYSGRYPGRYPDDRYHYYYYGGDRGKPYRPDYYSTRYADRYGNRYGDRFDDSYGVDRYPDRNRGRDRDRYNGYEDDDFDSRTGYRHRYNGNRYDRYDNDREPDGRWFYRPDRRPVGRPVDPRPPNRRPISPGPDGPIYDNYAGGAGGGYGGTGGTGGGYGGAGGTYGGAGGTYGGAGGSYGGAGGLGPNRPFTSRCDEWENFKQTGSRQRMRKEYVKQVLYAPSLRDCERECVESRDFICRSFNFKDPQPGGGGVGYDADRDNCELSDRDGRDLEVDNPQYFDNTGNYDFYERSGRQGNEDCLDVSQVCNEDGMEFTLRTQEPFYGRIYTYGFYDRCFFRGNGGTANVLRISGAQGYPECGTQRYADTMTNIAVVQFSDYVQTSKDKRFNLTCLFRGPGEAVVSSGFIGAGSGSPIPIEYLPAENSLSSKVRLLILYQGRPTTTIAVGDPLTFKLEAQDGYNYATDIFATNVVARDPYSGRSVQLIDRFGCPVDPYVFPELDKGRSGDSLEARFNAFKIPESNFLVFEATVRTCRDGCQPAYCQTGAGRSEPSFGRRKREINPNLDGESNNTISEEVGRNSTEEEVAFVTTSTENPTSTVGVKKKKSVSESKENGDDDDNEEEFVREMIEVFDSREELQQEARRAEFLPETVCLTPGAYHALVSTVMILVAILLTSSLLAGLAYKRYWGTLRKNILADRDSSHISSSYPTTRSSGSVSIFGLQRNLNFGRGIPSFPKPDLECPVLSPGGPFEDPSEPIYTDPSLFERSRSLRSISVTPKRRKSPVGNK